MNYDIFIDPFLWQTILQVIGYDYEQRRDNFEDKGSREFLYTNHLYLGYSILTLSNINTD